MAPLVLYTAEGSPPSNAILSVAAALGLKIEEKKLDITKMEQMKPEFLKINPQHTVPTLVDGDFVLWESHAISIYLITKYGKNDSLYPQDFKKRALINQRLHFNSSILYPRIRSILYQVMFFRKDVINRDDIDEAYKGCRFLEEFLGKNKWVTGNEMNVADISIASTMNILSLGLPLDEAKYSNVLAWLKRFKALPIYKENSPETVMVGQLIKQAVIKTLASK